MSNSIANMRNFTENLHIYGKYTQFFIFVVFIPLCYIKFRSYYCQHVVLDSI
jgi:hypothetical protein